MCACAVWNAVSTIPSIAPGYSKKRRFSLFKSRSLVPAAAAPAACPLPLPAGRQRRALRSVSKSSPHRGRPSKSHPRVRPAARPSFSAALLFSAETIAFKLMLCAGKARRLLPGHRAWRRAASRAAARGRAPGSARSRTASAKRGYDDYDDDDDDGFMLSLKENTIA